MASDIVIKQSKHLKQARESSLMIIISLLGYAMSISVLTLYYLSISDYQKYLLVVLHVSSLSILGLLPCLPQRKILYCANFLGYCTAFGVIVAKQSVLYSSFGWYIIFMSAFHYLEFLTTGLTNPKNLSVESYLINHSLEYGVSAMASWMVSTGEFDRPILRSSRCNS